MPLSLANGVGLSSFARSGGGGAAPVIPSTAIRVPINTGLLMPVTAALAPAGLLRSHSFAFWARIDSRPEQYWSFYTTVGGVYLFFGVDFLAGGGLRNICAFGTGYGGHCVGAYPANGSWNHIGVTVEGNYARAWLNKVPQEWDGGGPDPLQQQLLPADTGWPGTTGLRFCNELGAGQNMDGAMRALYVGTEVLTQDDVDDLYDESSPLLESGNISSYPLALKTDLANAVVDGPALTVEGTLGTDTTGPTAITQP